MFDGMDHVQRIHESLNNAVENADPDFLSSVECQDVEAIANDLADCDADVEAMLDKAEDRDLCFEEIKDIVRDWINDRTADKVQLSPEKPK